MLFVHKGTVNWSKNKENAEILRFFINFPRKILVVREKVVPLHRVFEKRGTKLGYGVMVTLQILVLSFLVRVRVPQLESFLNGKLF